MNQRFGQALRRIGGGLSAGGAYPIGLQLGRDSLSLVQMEKTAAGPPAFRAAAALDYECAREEILSNPLRLKALLKRAFAQQDRKSVV